MRKDHLEIVDIRLQYSDQAHSVVTMPSPADAKNVEAQCFVIMPFAKEFSDVFSTIKSHVESVGGVTCKRLDETRPAGRITERLLAALKDSSFCISDLTGCNPNVMWETGYAMALGKPIVVVTQDASGLPFDMKDLQSLPYDRTQLNATLGGPLKGVVRDTLMHLSTIPTVGSVASTKEEYSRHIVGLGIQLAELKEMVGQIVKSWDVVTPQKAHDDERKIAALEGAWINEGGKTHLYARVISGRLVMPYCYGGNRELTAYYYGWKRSGDYLFGRFRWVHEPSLCGFAFLKPVDKDTLQGAWWLEWEAEFSSAPMPNTSGTPAVWRRLPAHTKTPAWALEFFDRVLRGDVDVDSD